MKAMDSCIKNVSKYPFLVSIHFAISSSSDLGSWKNRAIFAMIAGDG
jgi:hypothetical protein